MKVLVASILILLFTSSSFAAIYQTQDENGKIIFTDRPESGGSEKTLTKPTIITIKKSPVEKKPVSGLGELKVKEEKAVSYKQFAITAPIHDAAVRNNIGTMELKLQIIPELQAKFDHRIKVKLDGQMQKESWKSTSILFLNVDRGTHTFQAFIVDKSGKRLKTSKSVTFHLQRFSSHFK